MKYPSPDDIAEMKARGYDSTTIAAAKEQSKKWALAQDLILAVEQAFAGVTLGSGVGLFEGRGLDDYADAETLAAYRAEDEKDDWRKIPVEDLNHFQSSLSFFDAEGMRFHLPAYLIADLRDEGHATMAHQFINLYDGHAALRAEKFALLSDAQRATVRTYLQLIIDDPDEQRHRQEIERALQEEWT